MRIGGRSPDRELILPCVGGHGGYRLFTTTGKKRPMLADDQSAWHPARDAFGDMGLAIDLAGRAAGPTAARPLGPCSFFRTRVGRLRTTLRGQLRTSPRHHA